jgi:hypothetical protein
MERQYVGIDLHRRRSVIYQMDEGGERVSCVRVENDPWRFAEAVSRAHGQLLAHHLGDQVGLS